MKTKRLLCILVLALLLVGYGRPIGLPVPIPTDTPSLDPALGQSCSSFCLDNNGSPVFGTNFDHVIHEGLLFVNKRDMNKVARETSTTGHRARWTSKYGSVTFNLVSYQYAWAGMNEAGLMISTMALPETRNPDPDSRPPLESPFWMQYVLDNCGTVEEVIASDTRVRILNTVDHYLVCDRAGACATIEFLEGQMVVHTGGTLPVPALTNSIYEESLASWQENRERSIPTVPRGSLRRFHIAANRLSSFDPDRDEAIAYAFETLARADDGYTQWSIVFDAQALRVYFRTGTNSDIRYFDLAVLDFSCTTPVEMLDIHEPLSGDIATAFIEYDHEISLQHLSRFFEDWEIDSSPFNTRQFLKYLESFPCAGGGIPIQEAAVPEAAAVSGDTPAPVQVDPDSPIRWTELLLLAWSVLTVGSLAFLLGNLARGRPAGWSGKLAWALLVLLLGPLGLLAYLARGRKSP